MDSKSVTDTDVTECLSVSNIVYSLVVRMLFCHRVIWINVRFLKNIINRFHHTVFAN